MQALLGNESQAFFAALEERAPVSLLSNKNKKQSGLIDSAEPVPWCPNSYYLDERPEFIFDPAFHAGAYYVMEASSMMLWQALDTLFESPHNLRILDLCGAPGGKAMVAANFIGDKSILVINEVNRNRFQVLKENVAKWGMPNIYTTNYDPSKITLDEKFDCVIVDAPCSGEGLFRKTPNAINAWSLSNVMHCSKRQKRILKEAARMVRPGGFLIYSTCTYNKDENIRNVSYISDNKPFESIRLKLKFNTKEQHFKDRYGYQCFPHKVKGEGFFLAALKKSGNPDSQSTSRFKAKAGIANKASRKEIAQWEPFTKNLENFALFTNDAGTYYAVAMDIVEDYMKINAALPHGSPTLILGQIKGTDIVPHHSLALSNFINDDLPRIDLSLEQSIAYLRKDVITGISTDTTGWKLASYQGHILGWFKQTSRHLKNYFPTNLRIRKRE